jgi:N-acetylneuraminic acid mutarotase
VRSGHSNAIIGNYVYTLGGSSTTDGTLNAVERATINTGGAIHTFDAGAGTSLQAGSESHTSTVVGHHLYVFGGGGDTDVLSRVESADIAADGSLGPFTKPRRAALSTGRYLYACAVAGNHIYLIGGRSADSNGMATIDESVASADGTLGFIEPAIVHLQNLRHSHTAVTIGTHMYVVGGIGSSTSPITVEHAGIAADGSLGPFAVISGVNLSVPRAGHSSVVLGNFLYNLGGFDSSALATVERAMINPDGSLGPFAMVPGVMLRNGRAYHASVAIGNYLYVFGGMNQTGTPLDSVERAAVAADGSLGPFVAVSGVKLITARFGLTAVAVAGQVYVIGGRGAAGGRLTSVERATLDSGDGL